MIRWLLCLFVSSALLVAHPKCASAIDFPLTAHDRSDAKAQAADIAGDPTQALTPYHIAADRSTWPNFTPEATVATPYLHAMLAYAMAKAKYEDPDPKEIALFSTYPEFDVSAKLFWKKSGANSDAVGLIEQSGKRIKATEVVVGDESVVETPEVGYAQNVRFRFNLRSLNFKQPFTVIFANIPVFSSADSASPFGEIRFEIDPSTLR